MKRAGAFTNLSVSKTTSVSLRSWARSISPDRSTEDLDRTAVVAAKLKAQLYFGQDQDLYQLRIFFVSSDSAQTNLYLNSVSAASKLRLSFISAQTQLYLRPHSASSQPTLSFNLAHTQL